MTCPSLVFIANQIEMHPGIMGSLITHFHLEDTDPGQNLEGDQLVATTHPHGWMKPFTA